MIEKSGYSNRQSRVQSTSQSLEARLFQAQTNLVENHLRTKDKINLSHRFHTRVLNVLGYDAEQTNYDDLFPLSERAVLPVRHILYRGEQPHLMVMEMHAMIKTRDEEEPDGLFDQSYNVTENGEDQKSTTQKYHRSQWADIFTVPEGITISPMVINKAVSELFLLPTYQRPRYILLCAGNVYFYLRQRNGSAAPTYNSTWRYCLTMPQSTRITSPFSIFYWGKNSWLLLPRWC